MGPGNIEEICRDNAIELLIVFGSVAKGKPKPLSDIDMAVKLERGAEVSKLDLIFHLGACFSEREIDLVLLSRDTDPILLREIFDSGRLLYEARPGIFDKERLRAWKLYLDTERLREMRTKYLKDFVEQAGHVS